MRAIELATRLRGLNGFDEDWLTSCGRMSTTPAISHELLARCLASASGTADPDLVEAVRGLTLAERDWLLLQLRLKSLGDRMVGEVRCPACGNAIEMRFAATDIPLDPSSRSEQEELRLPNGRVAGLKPLTAGDHEYFASLSGLDAEQQRTTALARSVTAIDGIGAADSLEGLSTSDKAALEQALELSTPEGLRLDTTCDRCERAFVTRFDVPGFIVAELREHSKTLLDDVHTLARAYHWSESEIFRLSLQRRVTYLLRVEADSDGALLREELVG